MVTIIVFMAQEQKFFDSIGSLYHFSISEQASGGVKIHRYLSQKGSL